MRRLPLLVLSAAALALGACTSFDPAAGDPARILSVSSPGEVLRAGSTYALMRDSGLLSTDVDDAEQVARVLDRALHDALAERDLVRTDDGRPRLYVGYVAAETEDLDSHTIARRFGLAEGPDGWLDDLPTGTFLVVVMDAATRALIWRGSTQVAIHLDLPPEQRDARLAGHVRRLLAHMPVVDG